MILHIFEDDKFADYTIRQFNSIALVNNRFVVFVPNNSYDCIYIEQQVLTDKIVDGSHAFEQLCSSLDSYSAIILHGISRPYHARLINEAYGKIPVAWVFWGFEVYSRNENYTTFLGHLTKKLANHYRLKSHLRRLYRSIRTGKIKKQAFNVSASSFQKIDYCLTHIQEDYQFAKNYFNGSFKHMWYNYFGIDITLGKLKYEKINGENILIGNSATLSNNHLEVFKILKNIELNQRKIIVPLSYGNTKYAADIKKKGAVIFGNQFMPLTTFMERSIYNGLVQSCSVVIMNHYRQQAMGNLITALWLGAKVFMSERSTAYAYVKRLGLYVLSIENELKPGREGVLNSLDEELVVRNKKILLAEYGEENMNKRIAELIDTLIK